MRSEITEEIVDEKEIIEKRIIKTVHSIGQISEEEFRSFFENGLISEESGFLTVENLQNTLNSFNGELLTSLLIKIIEIPDATTMDTSGKRALCGYVALSKNFGTITDEQKSQIFDAIKGVGTLKGGLAQTLIDSAADVRFSGLNKFVIDLDLKKRVEESLAELSTLGIITQTPSEIINEVPTSNPHQPSFFRNLINCLPFCGGRQDR